MTTLEKIQYPIQEQVERYTDFITSALQSDNTYVSSICNYILSTRGKQLRPLLALLAAALHGKIAEKSYMGASLVEMIHTASLIHDDVVDEAYIRRGEPSVNALWRSHTAVLIGDYIFARCYHICLENGGVEMLSEVTRSIHEVSEGELMQTEQTETLTMTRDIYFDIIHRKTASLIGASAAVGALSVGASTEAVQAMRGFGNALGVAFQIKDDILDYSPTAVTGKPTCGDLRERKITLPLLCLLESSDTARRRELMERLSNVRHSAADVEYLSAAVIESGSLEQAAAAMHQYKEQALCYLVGYPESEILNSMRLFADFVLDREM